MQGPRAGLGLVVFEAFIKKNKNQKTVPTLLRAEQIKPRLARARQSQAARGLVRCHTNHSWVLSRTNGPQRCPQAGDHCDVENEGARFRRCAERLVDAGRRGRVAQVRDGRGVPQEGDTGNAEEQADLRPVLELEPGRPCRRPRDGDGVSEAP